MLTILKHHHFRNQYNTLKIFLNKIIEIIKKNMIYHLS